MLFVRCCGKRIVFLIIVVVLFVNVFFLMCLCLSWSWFIFIRVKFEKEFSRLLFIMWILFFLDGFEEVFLGFGILLNMCIIFGSYKFELMVKLECMVLSNLVIFLLVFCFRRVESRLRSYCFLVMDESIMGMVSVFFFLLSIIMFFWWE